MYLSVQSASSPLESFIVYVFMAAQPVVSPQKNCTVPVFSCIASSLTVGEMHSSCVCLYSWVCHHWRAVQFVYLTVQPVDVPQESCTMCVFTCIASQLTIGELHHVCVYLYSQLTYHRRAAPCVCLPVQPVDSPKESCTMCTFICIAIQLTIGELHHVCVYLYSQLTYHMRTASCVFTCIVS